MPKKCSNYHTSALISLASKVMLTILQAILQQYMNRELSDVQAGFRNLWPRNQRSNCQHLMEHRKSKRVPENIYFCLLTTPKPLPVWITTNCGKFFKRWEYQTTWPASWEVCMQVKKQQLEMDTEQQTSSKLGKDYVKSVYCHPVYLTYMQSISCEMPGWMKHKLDSRLPGKISTTSEMQMTPPLWQKAKKN